MGLQLQDNTGMVNPHLLLLKLKSHSSTQRLVLLSLPPDNTGMANHHLPWPNTKSHSSTQKLVSPSLPPDNTGMDNLLLPWPKKNQHTVKVISTKLLTQAHQE